MEIVIIGTGNTASILGRKLKAAGHTIVQIFGRDAKAASDLAYELDTESTNYWSVVNREADLYLLAVSDIAIPEIIKELQLPDKMVVHTAAAVSKDVLQYAAAHYGVFYPLQSLRKETSYLPETPILIDAGDAQTVQELEQLAQSITNTVVYADDTQRLKIHLAAVFCNNFVNHLYALMEQYCKDENINYTLLLPLMEETIQRIKHYSPSSMQTGPAVRNDQSTIEKHIQLLTPHPELKEIYDLFTRSIARHKKGEK